MSPAFILRNFIIIFPLLSHAMPLFFLFLIAFFPLSVYCLLLDAAIRGQFGYSGDRAVGKADKGKEEKDVEKEDVEEEEEEGGECMRDCR